MDYCFEICGDGIDFRYYDCDDGNTVSGDGCDSSCKIELGYKCEGGTVDDYPDPDPDICYEICGDGLDLQQYECDDMNNVNGDGCNENCEIEPGWACEYGTRDWHDWCWHWHNNPAIDSSYIINDSEMHVFFNTSVQLIGEAWDEHVDV